MKLSILENFNDIVIQMHDNPDADAIGSGYAIYRYLQSKGKAPRLVYGGNFLITKSNIKILIDELKIPVEYVTKLDNPELLITVDCQYGEGNVKYFDAQNVAIIDHHNTGRVSDEMSEIRSHLVSCSTICFDMLKRSGYDLKNDIALSTTLYYGLFMDSNGFAELRHSVERDMIDELVIDKALIKKMVHSNFTIQELETAGIALIRYSFDENKRVSIIKSKPCDPNILGLIGDLVLQVDTIDVCVIYNECNGGYKLSVRSCVTDVAANDVAVYLTKGIGNGGGHIDKAGGYISKKQFEHKYSEMGIESYFFERVNDYYESYDTVYAKDGIHDATGFELYTKQPVIYGYARSLDIFEKGEEFRIRSLEGVDVYVVADEKLYIMIGYYGEAYPINKDIFEQKYKPIDRLFERDFEYNPSVRSIRTDDLYELIPYAKECVCRDGVKILAKPIEKTTKVFIKWEHDRYIQGEPGDMLCKSVNDDYDVYLIKREVFDVTYKKDNE